MSARPARDNGLGKTVVATDRYCRFIESFLAVLPETTAIFAEWRSLVVVHEVPGKQVYDARLVATMKAHAIVRILTFNVQDFTRYKDVGVEAVHPEMA